METQINLSDTKSSTFSSIYTTYYKKMYAYGIALGFCENLCKDAVHDVFCTVYNSVKPLDYVENIESYLLKSLKNRLFDIYKEQKKICCTCYDDQLVDKDVDLIGTIINEENQLQKKEVVEKLLKNLKPKQRKIIYCRFHHNLKFDEIAVVMDMSTDAVKKMLYRSLRQMGQGRDVTSCNLY